MQREWTVCRLCFKKCVPKEYSTNTNGNVNQNNIFDVNNDSSSQFSYSLFQTSQETSTHFHKMIMSICSVQLSPDDGLPNILCYLCANDLIKAYNFKVNCEKSQTKLNKLLKYFKLKNGVHLIKDEAHDLNLINFDNDFTDTDDIVCDLERNFLLQMEQNFVDVKIEQVDIKLDPTLYDTSDYDDNKDTLDYFETKLKTNKHKKRKKSLICTVCKYTGVSLSDLRDHMKGHDEFSLFYCDQCSFKCESLTEIKEHKQTHPDIQCEECNLTYKTYAELEKHRQKKHLEEKKFSCDECNFKTKRKCTLNMHKKQHTGEKQYCCELCPYQAIQKAKLDNHIMMVHTGERPFACDKCSYRCVSALKLKEHNKVHTGEKPFLCDECDYRCITITVLNKHKSSKHSSERNFACDKCDFKTKTKSTLMVHKKRHTGEKRFACEFCSFKAIQKTRLDVHIKMVHTGERPFACNFCSYRCADSNYLKIHQRNHSIKRFTCDECGYSCHTKFRLKTHKFMHTGERPHKCDMCDFKCTKNSVLRRHMERIHNIDAKDKFRDIFTADVHSVEDL